MLHSLPNGFEFYKNTICLVNLWGFLVKLLEEVGAQVLTIKSVRLYGIKSEIKFCEFKNILDVIIDK